MIICICKGVSDRSIRRAAERGEVVSLRDLTRDTGLGTCCGKCVPAARDVLRDAVSRAAAPTPVTLPMTLPGSAALGTFDLQPGC